MLNPRQAQFVTHFHVSGNATRAAIAAGYAAGSAEVTACRLLRNERVGAALAERRAQAEVEFKITRRNVVNGLLVAIEAAKRAQNPMAMIRGWAELAKLLGFYAPEVKRVELSTRSQARRADYEAMTDEELLQIVAG